MSATKFDHPEEPSALIFYLGEYFPWTWHKQLGGNSSNYPRYSGQLLDLKQSQIASLKNFTELITNDLAKTYVGVTAVPSHHPANGIGTGVRLLAKQVAAKIGASDGRGFLRRTKKIESLHGGGDRAVHVHLDSIVAEQREVYEAGRVLLIDDILTSGNSLVACRRILLEAGASEVICVALGRTKH